MLGDFLIIIAAICTFIQATWTLVTIKFPHPYVQQVCKEYGWIPIPPTDIQIEMGISTPHLSSILCRSSLPPLPLLTIFLGCLAPGSGVRIKHQHTSWGREIMYASNLCILLCILCILEICSWPPSTATLASIRSGKNLS